MSTRAKTVSRLLAALLAPSISGCAGIQSALDPKGPYAEVISELSWVMFAGAAVVFLLVVALLAYALFSKPESRRSLNGTGFIIAGGVVLPVVTLSALLLYALFAQRVLVAEPEQEPLVIEVIGHQWWWQLRYHVGEFPKFVETANEIHIPAGTPVELRLKSYDVIHTFWVPNLAGKRDMIPGHTNTLYIQADMPGLFRGQCNEFCGAQHALMNLYVISEPVAEFERWLDEQRREQSQPETGQLNKGYDAFMANGCANCHAIRGTPARGQYGPDLTHFGSRRTIATILDNNIANRQAWIVSAQHLKPDNKMGNYEMDGETLHALAAYLGSLE